MRADIEPIVTIKAQVPDDAMSAGLLGTERTGHGVRIRDDGLIATIGYVIHEAEGIWITSNDGVTVPGFVLGYDYESGLGLVKPTMPLVGPSMPLGSAAELSAGDRVTVAASSGDNPIISASVIAKREFAGRWEYLIDNAIYTSPHHDSWSGAALIDERGRLCGIGSLVIQNFEVGGLRTTVNMFVPIELLKPVIDEVCNFGRRQSPARPWLGMLVQDDKDELTVVGIYRNCPADKAGLKPGDVILRINDVPVEGESLATMFRHIWSLGSAGVDVPIRIRRDAERLDKVVHSADRVSYQWKGTVQ